MKKIKTRELCTYKKKRTFIISVKSTSCDTGSASVLCHHNKS